MQKGESELETKFVIFLFFREKRRNEIVCAASFRYPPRQPLEPPRLAPRPGPALHVRGQRVQGEVFFLKNKI